MNEYWRSEDGIKNHDNDSNVGHSGVNSWENCYTSDNCKAHSGHVWLGNLHGKDGLQKEWSNSCHVESEVKEADQLFLLGTVDVKGKLGENEDGTDELEGNIFVLLESVLGPRLHGESLNAGPVNLIWSVFVSKSEVWVSNHSDDHAEEHEVKSLLKSKHSNEGKEDWGEVNLEGIEVSDVGSVDEAEKADQRVSEYNNWVALMLLVHDKAD